MHFLKTVCVVPKSPQQRAVRATHFRKWKIFVKTENLFIKKKKKKVFSWILFGFERESTSTLAQDIESTAGFTTRVWLSETNTRDCWLWIELKRLLFLHLFLLPWKVKTLRRPHDAVVLFTSSIQSTTKEICAVFTPLSPFCFFFCLEWNVDLFVSILWFTWRFYLNSCLMWCSGLSPASSSHPIMWRCEAEKCSLCHFNQFSSRFSVDLNLYWPTQKNHQHTSVEIFKYYLMFHKFRHIKIQSSLAVSTFKYQLL